MFWFSLTRCSMKMCKMMLTYYYADPKKYEKVSMTLPRVGVGGSVIIFHTIYKYGQRFVQYSYRFVFF